MKMSDNIGSNIFLRRVKYSDLDLLFKWANDPVVRSNSFNTESISYNEHVKWFEEMIENPTILQFILIDDDIPVGQVRLDVDGDEAEIGYSIGPAYRGKGYGHKILQLVLEEVKINYPSINRLISRVKADNTISNKLFVSEGYELFYSCYVHKI